MKRITEQCDSFGKIQKPLSSANLGNKKSTVLEYMKQRKFVVEASTARVRDFVIDEVNEKYCILKFSDGEYEWTSNDILYVEEYNIKLDDDFISKITSKTA